MLGGGGGTTKNRASASSRTSSTQNLFKPNPNYSSKHQKPTSGSTALMQSGRCSSGGKSQEAASQHAHSSSAISAGKQGTIMNNESSMCLRNHFQDISDSSMIKSIGRDSEVYHRQTGEGDGCKKTPGLGTRELYSLSHSSAKLMESSK